MTENEAIEEFKQRLELIEKCYRGEVEDYKQALELGVKALEKQIAKKPTPIDYEKYMDTVKNALFLKGSYWCPNCNHVVKCGTYCSDCCQKLDWSDEE